MKFDTLKQLKPFLDHILEGTAYLISNSTKISYREFEKNETFKRSFVRSLEVIGEATKNIPGEFRKKYPLIPWKDLAGLRDILIHRYFGINYRMVWDIVKNQVPVLEEKIRSILTAMDLDGDPPGTTTRSQPK